jgi:hypothetical protein
VNFKWWASAGLLARIRHGFDPTNLEVGFPAKRHQRDLTESPLVSIAARLAKRFSAKLGIEILAPLPLLGHD